MNLFVHVLQKVITLSRCVTSFQILCPAHTCLIYSYTLSGTLSIISWCIKYFIAKKSNQSDWLEFRHIQWSWLPVFAKALFVLHTCTFTYTHVVYLIWKINMFYMLILLPTNKSALLGVCKVGAAHSQVKNKKNPTVLLGIQTRMLLWPTSFISHEAIHTQVLKKHPKGCCNTRYPYDATI